MVFPQPIPLTPSMLSATRQIYLELVLGKASDNCRHYGICRVDMVFPSASPFASTNCEQVRALLSLSPDGVMEMRVLKNSICDKILNRFFTTDYFLLDEAFHFPKEVCKILQEEDITLQEGIYPIVKQLEYYTIKFGVIKLVL